MTAVFPPVIVKFSCHKQIMPKKFALPDEKLSRPWSFRRFEDNP